MGLGDAGSHDLFGEFEAWEETSFWPAAKPLSKSNLSEDQSLQLSVQVVPDPRADILNREPLSATVIKVETLTSPGEPVKTHLELEMPDNAEYQCGEYLGILPKNPPSVVNRALKRLGLEESDYLIVKKPCVAALPTDSPVSALDLLSIYVELQDPASRSVSLPDAQPIYHGCCHHSFGMRHNVVYANTSRTGRLLSRLARDQ